MPGSSRMANQVVRRLRVSVADIPVFLCPSILRLATRPLTQSSHPHPRCQGALQRRGFSASIRYKAQEVAAVKTQHSLDQLPYQCAGCGALSQNVDQDRPGFYTLTRTSVRHYLDTISGSKQDKLSAEDALVKKALENAGEAASSMRLGDFIKQAQPSEPPMCDRCHKLKNHETGASILHPSIQSIQDTIFESPYKYNHIYHVIDAADFPMSLVSGLHKLLHLTPQRSLNRRAKSGKFYHGKKTEVSFIITRSDLLAPVKEQVDSMMPYLRETLRDALGSTGQDVRLGNVRCVSAKKGWWTRELKREIWKRGGGGWMVGKVNVGKSQLFHDVFPKGRMQKGKPGIDKSPSIPPEDLFSLNQHINRMHQATLKAYEVKKDPIEMIREINAADTAAAEVQARRIEGGELEAAIEEEIAAAELAEEEKYKNSLEQESAGTVLDPESAKVEPEEEEKEENNSFATDSLDTNSLLPPVPPEVNYPVMPLVSSLPGTTASPIRLAFGNGKGELIDLPGLSRSDLELHVQPEHRSELVMRSRITPEQQVIKPSQSLLLGGFIRITPTTSDLIFLSYAFTPIKPHLTATEKAIGIQNRTSKSNVENISLPCTAEKIKSAGIFHLKWDVTKQRAGPITSPKAVGIKPDKLLFKVLATDILIEGCGWVELVAQIRRRQESEPQKEEKELETQNKDIETAEAAWEQRPENEEINPEWPAVEVFSPEGKFISSRRPMNAWLFLASKTKQGKLQGRPRKSMKGAKKMERRRKMELF